MILLDMDGVCCDFTGALLKMFGKTEKDYLYRMGYSRGKHPYDILQETCAVTAQEFYEAYSKTPGFYENLEPFPWFHELWRGLNQIQDVYFLTSGPSVKAFSGKAAWVEKHLGEQYVRRCIVCAAEAKCGMAKPGNILIDDTDRNIEQFREAGGQAFYFPSLQFWGHHPSSDAVDQCIAWAAECLKKPAAISRSSSSDYRDWDWADQQENE